MLIKSYILPKEGFGEVLSIILFPFLFFAYLAAAAFLFRGRLAALFLRAKKHFLIRAEALGIIAKTIGVDYSPVPGGASPGLKALTKWRFCPQIIKHVCALMEEHSGFESESAIIRASGLAIPNQFLLGKDETKEKLYAQQINEQQFEDGFRGVRGNIPFVALQWTEKLDEGETHHPYSACGPVRGVAFDNHLVVDLSGPDRFEILDLMSGKWSEESIDATLTDFEHMLGFVDAISQAFSVKPPRALAS